MYAAGATESRMEVPGTTAAAKPPEFELNLRPGVHMSPPRLENASFWLSQRRYLCVDWEVIIKCVKHETNTVPVGYR